MNETEEEIYPVTRDGNIVRYEEIKNAHHGALSVWRKLWWNYLWGEFTHAPLAVEVDKLWDLVDNDKLEDWERVTLRTTFDNVVIAKALFGKVVDSFRKFHDANPEGSFLEQAKVLERLRKDSDILGVAWNQMSAGAYAGDYDDDTDEYTPMSSFCDGQGRPRAKLHGLRMLDAEVFQLFPFASADSTNVGQNIRNEERWSGPYSPTSHEIRAVVLAGRIEIFQSAVTWNPRARAEIQQGLFSCGGLD